MDELFDFESEELPLRPVPAKKRKKIIGLDDLVTDFYKEKSKHIEKEAKRAKAKSTYYSSDEEKDEREAALCKCVDEFQQKIHDISDDAEISLWGLQVFGNKKDMPTLVFPELESCLLLKSNLDPHVPVELNSEKGGPFLEGLLVNGWLLKLVLVCGLIERSIATWTFNLMLYSSEEVLRDSACDFWCAILTLREKGNSLRVKFDWLPSYSEIKGALQAYGFLMLSPTRLEMVCAGSTCVPPTQIGAWIRCVAACSQVRNLHSIISTSEAEDLLVWVICLLLDRQLLGLSLILHDCMLSLISSFTDDEWNNSCERVAISLACRIPADINCLRIVESISGADARSKHLRRRVASQFLLSRFKDKVLNEEEVLQFLISINLKSKNCDLFKAHIYLALTENWLLSNPLLEKRPVIKEMWGLYLRNFACQISSTDLRSYASKLRSKAAYILQGTSGI